LLKRERSKGSGRVKAIGRTMALVLYKAVRFMRESKQKELWFCYRLVLVSFL
jgi:hypothetical protein